MTYNVHTAFGREAIAALSSREVCALMRDIRAIVNDEQRTGEDACLVLRTRIGGSVNLRPYIASLLAGER
jgi:hypothetical protein